MTHKHKGLIYTQKKLDNKGKAGKALRIQVLRCVLAVGFALSPWLGGEAFADPGIVRVDGTSCTTTQFLDGNSNVAHIKAEQVNTAGTVGLNRFQKFNVSDTQTAHLYFQTEQGTKFDTLVNTVQNQISINGTVNAIKNDAVGGHLYFISPNGMVVGASGVINAGRLTVIGANLQSNDATPNQYFETADKAASAISSGNFDFNSSAGIEIKGRINTATGIDLKAAYINMTKATDPSNSTVPSLKTGVVFKKIVNTETYEVDETQRLTASSGDNRIRLYAKYDSNNSNNSGKIALSDGVGSVYIEADRTIAIANGDIDASGRVDIIAYKNSDHQCDIGEVTLTNSTVDAGNDIFVAADHAISLEDTNIDTDSEIELRSKWYEDTNNYGG